MPARKLSILFTIPILFSFACSKKPVASTAPTVAPPPLPPAASASVVTPAPVATLPPRNVLRVEKKTHVATAPAIRIEYPRLVLSDQEATEKLDRLLQTAIIPDDEMRANYRSESNHSFHKMKCTSAFTASDLFSVRCVMHTSIGGADEPRTLEGHTYRIASDIREIDLDKELFEKESRYKEALDNFWEGKPLDAHTDVDSDFPRVKPFAITEKGILLTQTTEVYGEDPKPKLLPWKTIGKMLTWPYRERFL